MYLFVKSAYFLYFAIKYNLNVNFRVKNIKNFYVLKRVNDKNHIDNGGFLCYTFFGCEKSIKKFFFGGEK